MEPERAAAEARVGALLRGKWRLDRLLGMGGMASVYAATHRNGKRVAVKMLHPRLAIDEDARARFTREGYAANKVDHPGALAVLDDDIAEDGAPFLVMELLEGETVEAMRERAGGRLSPQQVLAIADQLLSVLAAAHRHGVVHRDLKPENLFLDREGKLRVLDFGLARFREARRGANHMSTLEGQILGTPAFLPPEQAAGRWDDVDGRTDLWAVGATMYNLLTGRLVHEAETLNEMLALAIVKKAPSLAAVMPEAPPAVVGVVDRALAQSKSQRFANAEEMQAAVRAAAATLPRVVPVAASFMRGDEEGPTALISAPSVIESSEAITKRRGAERRTTGKAVAFVAIALAMGAATFALLRHRAAKPSSEAPSVPPVTAAASSEPASVAPTIEREPVATSTVAASPPASPIVAPVRPALAISARPTAIATATAAPPPTVAPTKPTATASPDDPLDHRF